MTPRRRLVAVALLPLLLAGCTVPRRAPRRTHTGR